MTIELKAIKPLLSSPKGSRRNVESKDLMAFLLSTVRARIDTAHRPQVGPYPENRDTVRASSGARCKSVRACGAGLIDKPGDYAQCIACRSDFRGEILPSSLLVGRGGLWVKSFQ